MRCWAALIGAVLLVADSAVGQGVRAYGDPGSAEVAPAWDDSLPDDFLPELPEAVKTVQPRYPDLAREAGVTGTVMVVALVGRDGRVKDTHIVKSIPMLDAAAVEAVRQWVFKPAQANMRPIAVWVSIPMKFGSGPDTAGGAGLGDPLRAFVTKVMELQAGGPRVPSAADSAQRRRIVLDALALDPRPIVPEPARTGLERGRHARERCGCRDSTRVAVDRFTAALHEAPWWGEAYQRLGEALLRLDRRDGALVCLELCLLTGPEARDRKLIEKQIAELRKRPALKP